MAFGLFLLLFAAVLGPYVRFFIGSAPIYLQMLIIPVLFVLAVRQGWALWQRTSIRLWYWLFLGAMVFSSVIQMIILGSLKFSTYTLITHLLPAILLPTLIVLVGSRDGLFEKFRWYWAILASITALWCILQVVDQELGLHVVSRLDNFYYFTIAKVRAEELLGRKEWNIARGVAGAWNPNATGAILAVSLPVALGLPRQRRRLLVYLMNITIFFGMIATGSRQTMLAIVVCLAVFLLPGFSRRMATTSRARRPALVLLVILALGGLGYSAVGFGRAQVGRFAMGISEGIYTRSRGYAQFAAYMAQGGLQSVIGQGPDARRVGARTGNLKVGAGLGFVSNSWLLPIVEFGLAGFVGLVGMFIVAWRSSREIWARACLASTAWIMICDNAIHAVHFGPALLSMALAAGILTDIEAQYQEAYTLEQAYDSYDQYDQYDQDLVPA